VFQMLSNRQLLCLLAPVRETLRSLRRGRCHGVSVPQCVLYTHHSCRDEPRRGNMKICSITLSCLDGMNKMNAQWGWHIRPFAHVLVCDRDSTPSAHLIRISETCYVCLVITDLQKLLAPICWRKVQGYVLNLIAGNRDV
jgi:hypothetical protein